MNLDYFRLTPAQKIALKFKNFFGNFGKNFCSFFVRLGKKIASFFLKIGDGIKNYCINFVKGDIVTKFSYVFMGLGHVTRGQIVRGIAYFLVEVGFILYMVLFGGSNLIMFFAGMFSRGTIGYRETSTSGEWNDELGEYVTTVGDHSLKIVIYSVLTLAIVFMFFYFYFRSIRESVTLEQTKLIGQKAVGFKGDLKMLFDKNFHLPLLSVPLLLLFVFTVIPIIVMILIAFTNYDASHMPPNKLFSWVGFDNFKEVLTGDTLGKAFGNVLAWTLIWAFFATFTNYFLGMILALLINKKGIRFKKVFRTCFVATIAVPQFVSLLLMSKMLDPDGIISTFINNLFGYQMQFGRDTTTTRALIIIVNMWVGVPYSMLICSGILMNIPKDLYESARIDGAGPVRTFGKITLPYMLFVTGPYLITQFIGNINNFNVIYLLSGGGPPDPFKYGASGAQSTDLLVTWLYKLSLNDQKKFNIAGVIGIMVFVISAVFSLLVYNKSSAVQREEDFQ